MSAKCTAAVFDRYPGGGGEFALALALADNAHDDGTRIYPSIDTMALKSRQSVRAVQNHLRNMLAAGWLVLVKNHAGGRGVHREYRINPDWLKGADIAPFSGPVDNLEKGANLDIKGCKSRHKRVQNDAQKGADSCTPYITTRTSIEPNPLPPAGGVCGFDQFEAGYPRRIDMDRARREWDKLAPDAQLQGEIAQAIDAWIRSHEWRRDDGRFIPKPSNWLRNKRWRDVPGIAAPSPQPEPTPAPAPAMTPEQLQANGERARQAAALARQVLLGQRDAGAA